MEKIVKAVLGLKEIKDDPVFLSEFSQYLVEKYKPEERLSFGISDSLVRYSCGIEDAQDLLDDLEQALRFV